MNESESPKIREYILAFSGLFGCESEAQKRQLIAWDFYEAASLPYEVRLQLREQYYTGFSNFILNEGNEDQLLIYQSKNSREKLGALKIVRTNPFRPIDKNNQPDISFYIEKIELFFFPEKMGIFTIEVKLIVNDNSIITTQMLNEFSDIFRYLHTIILYDEQYFSLKSFIEEIILNSRDKSNKIFTSDHPEVKSFTGSKLKTYLVIELAESDKYSNKKELDYELFRLATHWWVTENSHDGGHSLAYFEKEMVHKINVYNNWQALCLFDTFIGLGTQIFSDKIDQINIRRLATWRNTYFRIYVYNLYFKFFLFQVNNNLINTPNIRLERKRLTGLLNYYNFEYISYNFLPNLIHQKIRKALEIDEETSKLQQKIESINLLIKEQQEWTLNRVVFALTLLSILPNGSELAPLVKGILFNIGVTKVISTNWLTLLEILLRGFVLIIFLALYYRRRIQASRSTEKNIKKQLLNKLRIQTNRPINLIPLSDLRRWHLIKHFSKIPEYYLRNLCQRTGHQLAEAHALQYAPGSKFVGDFATTPDQLFERLTVWINQALAQRTEYPEGKLEISISLPNSHYPNGIGTNGLVVLNSNLREDCVKEASLEDSTLFRWIIRDQTLQETNKLHVVLLRQGDKYELITAYCGTYAPPFPSVQYISTYASSLQFWHNHALCVLTSSQ